MGNPERPPHRENGKERGNLKENPTLPGSAVEKAQTVRKLVPLKVKH